MPKISQLDFGNAIVIDDIAKEPMGMVMLNNLLGYTGNGQ